MVRISWVNGWKWSAVYNSIYPGYLLSVYIYLYIYYLYIYIYIYVHTHIFHESLCYQTYLFASPSRWAPKSPVISRVPKSLHLFRGGISPVKPSFKDIYRGYISIKKRSAWGPPCPFCQLFGLENSRGEAKCRWDKFGVRGPNALCDPPDPQATVGLFKVICFVFYHRNITF